MTDTRLVTTLSPADAGVLKSALDSIAIDDTKTIAYLGVIIGMARGLSYRGNKFGDAPSIALIGVFEATPYDKDGAVVRGPSLFLPRAVQDMMVEAMIDGGEHAHTKAPKMGQKMDVDLGKQMQIKVEVGVMRTPLNAKGMSDGVGYKYTVNVVGELEKIDVLENLRADVLSNGNERMKSIGNVERIAAPSSVKKLAAPAKVAKKKK